jgi:peroxiredoxin
MLSVGGQAPDFILPALSGGQLSLGELTRAGPVLLAFFKVSCPTCQYTFPFLERLAGAPELRTIGISQDNPNATAEFCREYGVSFPVALDDAKSGFRVSNAYRITHVPTLFLVEGNSITDAFDGFSRRDLEGLGHRFGASLCRPGEKIPDFRPG